MMSHDGIGGVASEFRRLKNDIKFRTFFALQQITINTWHRRRMGLREIGGAT